MDPAWAGALKVGFQVLKTNEGAIERAVQIISGLTLITMATFGTIGVWGWVKSACGSELVWINC